MRETAPVNQTPIGPWRISRYADIAQIFKAAPTSMTLSDGKNSNFDPLESRGSFLEFMLNKDGDVHMRLRRLVVKAFTRNALAHMQRETEQAVDEAINKGIAEGGMDVIEVCLRFDPPVLFNWRILTQDYEIGGKRLPKDALLWLTLGAGNRDPEKFDDPDAFNIQRNNTQHLPFGGGEHFCLGHQLARMEARSANYP